jgi:hypothetical protein
MSAKYQFVNLRAMHHVMSGLSFNVRACAEVLDTALGELNKKRQFLTESSPGTNVVATLLDRLNCMMRRRSSLR